MEQLLTMNRQSPGDLFIEDTTSSEKSFISANTVAISLKDLKEHHVIPSFAKDNEPTISQVDFIESVYDAITDMYHGEQILKPSIRLSHPIKGRIPEAKNKPASELRDWEKTVYFERMMFSIEIPSITENINGNTVALTVGGVKAYNQDNLNSKKGSEEHFKFFVGFQNKVCTNLCVSSDGYAGDLKVRSLEALQQSIYKGLHSYNPLEHARNMELLSEYYITEQQFANILGRSRMYNYLSNSEKEGIPKMLYGDQQLGSICKDYYKDPDFCRDHYGNINLWKFYNLFTNANKSTYIDQFLERSLNAYDFANQLREAIDKGQRNWFLN